MPSAHRMMSLSLIHSHSWVRGDSDHTTSIQHDCYNHSGATASHLLLCLEPFCTDVYRSLSLSHSCLYLSLLIPSQQLSLCTSSVSFHSCRCFPIALSIYFQSVHLFVSSAVLSPSLVPVYCLFKLPPRGDHWSEYHQKKTV